MIKVNNFKIDIYLDGASMSDFRKYKNDRLIKGFTTNPSLMRKAGIKDYEKFCLMREGEYYDWVDFENSSYKSLSGVGFSEKKSDNV